MEPWKPKGGVVVDGFKGFRKSEENEAGEETSRLDKE